MTDTATGGNSATITTMRTVSAWDIARSLPSIVPDLPKVLQGLGLLKTIRGHHHRSIGATFQKHVARRPDAPFMRFAGHVWTYADANSRINQYASLLTAAGVRPGDTVGICITNRPAALMAVLATVKLGASAGMINHNQRGEVLDYAQKLLDSRVVLMGAECAETYASLPEGSSWRGTVIGVDSLYDLPVSGLRAGERPAALDGIEWVDEVLARMGGHASTRNPHETTRIRAKTVAYQVFTSGTTGLPKASKMTHLRWHKAMVAFGLSGARLRASDTLYCPLPLYHNNALTVALSAVLSAGACLAIGEKFSASRFWDDIASSKATAFIYIGELCRYLLNQPSRPAERHHRLRMAMGNGLRPELWQDFQKRFDIDRICEFYAASESAVAFVNAFNVPETAGYTTVTFKLVKVDPVSGELLRGPDGWLIEAKKGEVGQMIGGITATQPFDGYTDREATEKKIVRNAFKQGDAWFLSGDLMFNQGFNHVAFVDRLGDTFRWKGENVATTEVEGVVGALDCVDHATVYGVALPDADGRAGMAAISLRAGTSFDGAAAAAAWRAALPHYAVPLFVRIVHEIEQTSTFKNRKTELKDEGVDTSRFSDELFVLSKSEKGYVPFYDGAARDVVAGTV